MSKKTLIEYSKAVNIAKDLSEERLGRISSRVSQGFEHDLQSMGEWLASADEVIKLASLTKEPKNTPFTNAANVKYPLISQACLQFASNTYPEVVKDGKVVKTSILGTDFSNSKVDRGNRVSDFMNYQLLFQSSEWEEGLDKLLHLLPNIGCVFKKTYYDPATKVNCSEVCDYKDIVLDAKIQSLKSVRRISHILRDMCLNDIVKMARLDIYSDEAVQLILDKNKETDLMQPLELVEQHCYLDLDEDGFEEPYIVTYEKQTSNILRIKARYSEEDIYDNKKGIYCIEEESYFTDFHFLPNPNGSFLSVGFGTLMLHLNLAINTTWNQLMDAGTLANMQGGYIDSRIKLNTGSSRHNPGEWIRATPVMGQELSSGFVPLNYKEPSSVLFQLLGMMIQAGKELSASTDIQSGQVMPDNAKTGAVSSILERGLKVFNSIQRRFYRAEKNELQKLFNLNRKYLDESLYYKVLDDQKAVFKQDFNNEDLDITPISDPNLSSDSQRINQIQVLQGLKSDPGANIREINMRTLQYARIQEPEKIFPEPDQNAPPSPESIKLQADITAKSKELHQKDIELQQTQQTINISMQRLESEIKKIESETLKNLAQAEAADASTNLQELKLIMDGLQTKMDIIMQHKQMDQERERQQQPPLEAQNAPDQSGPAPPMGVPPDDGSVPPPM